MAEPSYDFQAMLEQLRSGALTNEVRGMRLRAEAGLKELQEGSKKLHEMSQRFGRQAASPRRSFKKMVRQQTPASPIDPHKLYTPAEIAALLNTSYDTAIRRMQTMRGCVDMGTKERRYKRGKRMLRVSGKMLREYLTNKRLKI